MPRCVGLKPDGCQCERIVDGRSPYCYSHDPSRKAQRKRAASIAGSAKPGSEIAEVKSQLRQLANDVLAKKVDRGTGSVTAQILGVWLKAAEVEVREREARIKELEFSQIRLPEFEQLSGEVAELKEAIAAKSSTGRGGSWAG